MTSVGAQVVQPLDALPIRFDRLWARLPPGPSFLLDSALPSPKLGRFSFLGAEPFATLRAWRIRHAGPGSNAHVRLDIHRQVGPQPWGAAATTVRTGDFYELLREVMSAFACTVAGPGPPPVPLVAGAVGYLAYEAGYFSESYPDEGLDDLGLPDAYLVMVDAVAAHDHVTGASYVGAAGWGDTRSAAEAQARQRCEAFAAQLTATAPPDPPDDEARDRQLGVTSTLSPANYAAAVEQVKHHLREGDAYEVCLTHRLETAEPVPDPWALYQALRSANPAPFASFLSFGDVTVASSSPERFLAVDRAGRAQSRPIKGTRPRGSTPEHDRELARSLASSAKDRAENLMVVDLVRNDFGRVCRPGSIHVPELFVVEPYPTVLQLVSTVVGELAEGNDALDLVRACFPGGSMTGAPKIAAMGIIDALEPVKRGVYSGALGYLDFGGPIDLSMVIRTFVIAAEGRCTYGVGGAVVIDSDPQDELAETMAKAAALHEALRLTTGAADVTVHLGEGAACDSSTMPPGDGSSP